MGMTDPYKISQLSKELVAAELRTAPDPYKLAAKTIRETVHAALRAIPSNDPSADLAIQEAVRGGLQGLILADLDVAKGGILVLREILELALDLGRDPQEAILSVMKGIASLKRLVRADQLDKLRLEIDADYHGAGEAFSNLLQRVSDPGAAEKRV